MMPLLGFTQNISIPLSDLKEVAKGAKAYEEAKKELRILVRQNARLDSSITILQVGAERDGVIITELKIGQGVLEDIIKQKDKAVFMLKGKNFLLGIGLAGAVGYIVYDKVIRQ